MIQARHAAACLGLIFAGLTVAADTSAPGGRSVTQGRAKTVIENIYQCPVKVGNHRISAVGTVRF